MSELYIGLMSGTSLDGVDGVLVDFDTGPLRVIAHRHRAFAPVLAQELLALNTPGDNELHRAALAGNAVATSYAEIVEDLLVASGAAREQIRAIGAHGQTVRHRPGDFDGIGYTLQLINPALLAERCGIHVIADLRSRDVAAGGQGAPLVPAFHRAAFGRPGETVAVLNLGGIANLTALRLDGTTVGFDCGPGNGLMDYWCRLHRAKPFDANGAWAAGGRVVSPLLAQMREEPYFALTPPKSTGRDLFNPSWLEAQLARSMAAETPIDVQATLAELIATTCADDVLTFAEDAREVLVCGGGARNLHLMHRLAARLPDKHVITSDERGLPAEQVEACAFAWLARAFTRRETGNLPSATGASGPRLLGALYPTH